MITGALKNQIDQIWNDMYSYGMSNPLVVIEQLTYLFFIKSLDDMETENEKAAAIFGTDFVRIFPQSSEGQEMRWSVFRNKKAEDIHEILRDRVFPFYQRTEGQRGGDKCKCLRPLYDECRILPPESAHHGEGCHGDLCSPPA
ncbi:MAG: type I restriction-modification system subunit M N-terminal domain-containing protein [Selenomonas sp.]|nr:type I restriction-modification system subunit M N-terminal domain-containing protein [Selenomonas sp.]